MDIYWYSIEQSMDKGGFFMAEKATGKNGKHAGERFLVTLDKDIHSKLAEIAELEGLGLATKARQILTMYVNGIQYVPVTTAPAKDPVKEKAPTHGTSLMGGGGLSLADDDE